MVTSFQEECIKFKHKVEDAETKMESEDCTKDKGAACYAFCGEKSF